MLTTGCLEITYEWVDEDENCICEEVRIYYRYSPGRPAVRYQRNGDPGWPAEPADIEFDYVQRQRNGTWHAVVDPTDMLVQWAERYLDQNTDRVLDEQGAR